MTDREKAIVMAYTGVCMLKGDKFQIFHKYVEDIMGRPIWTGDIGWLEKEIKEKSKADFMALCADESSSEKLNNWISVLDKLPEKEGLYIVTREYPWGSAIVDTSYWFKSKTDNHGFGISDRVIAWTSIEPYKASPTGAEGSE